MTSLARTCILICIAVAGTAAGNWVYRRDLRLREETDTAEAPDSLLARLRREGAEKGLAHAAFDLAAREPGRLTEIIMEANAAGETALADAAAGIWAGSDPQGMLEWLEQRPLNQGTTGRLAAAAFSGWTRTDAEAALDHSLKSMHPAIREAGVTVAFESAAQRDFSAGCRILARAPDVTPQAGAGPLLVKNVADLRTALALPASAWRDDQIGRWFASSPPPDQIGEAMALVKKLPPAQRSHAIREHIRHLAKADLASGLAALQEHLPGARGPGLAEFLLALPWPDLASAWDWCVLTLDGPDLTSAQRRILDTALASGPAAVTPFLESLSPGPLRAEFTARICALPQWKEKPSEFASWAEKAMTADERRMIVPGLIADWNLSPAQQTKLTERLVPPPDADPEFLPDDPKKKKKFEDTKDREE